jgi:hypothetical protein
LSLFLQELLVLLLCQLDKKQFQLAEIHADASRLSRLLSERLHRSLSTAIRNAHAIIFHSAGIYPLTLYIPMSESNNMRVGNS